MGDPTVEKVSLYHPEIEGLGSTYGSYIKNEFFSKFVDRHNIKTVLEYPIDPYYEIAGTGSLIFAVKGCNVTLLSPFEERLEKAKQLWNEYGLSAYLKTVKSDLTTAPFGSAKFDLVWNEYVIQNLEADFNTKPADCIREMVRISRKFVLIITSNRLNYGFPIHKASCLLRGSKSKFGSSRWMKGKPIRNILTELGIKKIEEGMIDIPPFPSFDALGFVRKVRGAFTKPEKPLEAKKSDADVIKMLEKYSFIERSSLPNILKIFFAHAVYVLGEKLRTF